MEFRLARTMRLVFLLSAISTLHVNAFEVETHGEMTSYAMAQSIFTGSPSASSIAKQLGLLNPTTWGKSAYVDIGAIATTRCDNEFVNQISARLSTVNVSTPPKYSLGGWLIHGSIREDDNRRETPESLEPGGVFNRVLAHFFDPQNNIGLLPLTGPRSVDWALVSGTTATLAQRTNHFKISDAREAMWRALTMTSKASGGGFNEDVWPTNWAAMQGTCGTSISPNDLRAAYWATTFRALGDVVHLLQDTAQPQHTRGDLHSGLGCIGTVQCTGGHSSFFERYLRARTLKSDAFSLHDSLLGGGNPVEHRTNAMQLNYVGYPVPSFNSYADFFSTGVLNANDTAKGLANYSNRGFYSAGTNINSTEAIERYPSPPPTGSGLGDVAIPMGELRDMTGASITGASVRLRTGLVRDTLNPLQDAPDVPLSSEGVWDQFLETRGFFRRPTLNYYNYDAQADLLVPRAVAYSAGLIDYFFRGRMAVTLPDSGVYAIRDHADFHAVNVAPTSVVGHKGFGTIRLKLQNTTADVQAPDQAYPQAMGSGVLVAVARFHRNLCYKDDLSGQAGAADVDPEACRSPTEEFLLSEIKPVNSVPGDAPKEFEFTFDPEIPINARDLYLQVAFRGALGTETDAVVVTTLDISEPTYISFMNATDYIRFAGVEYLRNSSIGPPVSSVVPQSCLDTTSTSGLADGCFPQVPIEVGWAFRPLPSNPDGAVVSVFLQPKLYSRLVVLTNDAMSSQPIYPLTVSGATVAWPFISDTSQWTFRPDGTVLEMTTPVIRLRETYQQNVYPQMHSGDGTPSNPMSSTNLARVTAPLDDIYPVRFDMITIPPMTQ